MVAVARSGQGWPGAQPGGWVAVAGWRLFFSSRLSEPLCLEEGVSDHCHERMAVQPGPGSALKMVEPEFLLELLMRLFADPTRLDGAGDALDWRVGGQVR